MQYFLYGPHIQLVSSNETQYAKGVEVVVGSIMVMRCQLNEDHTIKTTVIFLPPVSGTNGLMVQKLDCISNMNAHHTLKSSTFHCVS